MLGRLIAMFEFTKGQFRRAVVIAATTLALAVPAVPALAQELAPEHLALARQYVDLTDTAATFEVALVQTGIETMRTLLAQNPSLTEPVNTAINKVLESYKGQKSELLDQFARVYALRFSMDELRDIVGFYSSPTGKKLAASNLQINNDLQTVMDVYEANMKPEFFAKVRAELKAVGIKL